MTVSNEVIEVVHFGDDNTTAFPVTAFGFFELTVELVDGNGVRQKLTEDSDYSVVGGNGSTGTVTIFNPPASGVRVIIRRVTSLLQESDYEENDPFPAESHEKALDRLHMLAIEQRVAMRRLRALGPEEASATILNVEDGVAEPTSSYHALNTNSVLPEGAPLHTIVASNFKDGDFLVLRAANDRLVVLKNGIGNIILGQDRPLAGTSNVCLLMYVEALESWVEINGGVPGPQGPQGIAGLNGDGAGDVVGPAVAVANSFPIFDGTTGKLLKSGASTATAMLITEGEILNSRHDGVPGYRSVRTGSYGDGATIRSAKAYGLNHIGTPKLFAELRVVANDIVEDSESAYYELLTSIAGTLAARFRVGHGIYIGGITGGDKGAGTLNLNELYEANVRALTEAGGRTLTGGFGATPHDRGTVTTTTQTPTFAEGNVQTMVRNGAFTLNPPASGSGSITILVTNGASAGTLTTSGFTKANVDELTNTSGDDFLFHITKIGTFSRLHVEALQ